jgi:AcrR family transcriptional regulator
MTTAIGPQALVRTHQTRNARGNDVRSRILDCLRALLQANADIQEVSIQNLTSNVGITRSAFYYYFPTKYAALAELCGASWANPALHSTWFTSPFDGESPEQTVDRLVTGICQILADADPVLTATRRARHVDAGIGALLAHMTGGVADEIATLIRSEIARGAIPPHPDVSALTHILVGATVHSAIGSPAFVGLGHDTGPAIATVKALWLGTVWRTSQNMPRTP